MATKRQGTGRQPSSVVRKQLARERARKKAIIAATVATVLIVVMGIAGWFLYNKQKPDEAKGVIPASADETGVRVGTGKVIVDVYLDYICPGCKQFELRSADTLDKLAREGKATVVYHPLGFLDHLSTTRYSTRAAEASGCAADLGKFVEYTKVLFENQPDEGGPGLTDDKLVELAGKAGMDTAAFQTCAYSGKYAGWVYSLTEAADKRGIKSTPTVIVAGKKIANPTGETIEKAVDKAS